MLHLCSPQGVIRGRGALAREVRKAECVAFDGPNCTAKEKLSEHPGNQSASPDPHPLLDRRPGRPRIASNSYSARRSGCESYGFLLWAGRYSRSEKPVRAF
jgi:hypothetical protein